MDFIEVLFEVIYAAKPNTSWETFVSALLNNMGETCQLFFFSGSGLERLAEMLLPMNRDLGSYLWPGSLKDLSCWWNYIVLTDSYSAS